MSAPSNEEGAGKTGCALHPRSRVQKAEEKRTRAYRFSGGSPAFPARWCYGLLRALPGDRLSCHHRPPDAKSVFRELDASIGAPGPHDFAVRERLHSSFASAASTASHRACRDVRNAPLIG